MLTSLQFAATTDQLSSPLAALTALYAALPASAPTLALASPWAMQQYGASYPQNFFVHLGLLLRRQFTLMSRNSVYLRARIITAFIMSFVLGGLYFQRNPNISASIRCASALF